MKIGKGVSETLWNVEKGCGQVTLTSFYFPILNNFESCHFSTVNSINRAMTLSSILLSTITEALGI